MLSEQKQVEILFCLILNRSHGDEGKLIKKVVSELFLRADRQLFHIVNNSAIYPR